MCTSGGRDDDLAASLVDLSGLLTGRRPLPETLTEIAGFAMRAVPGADGVGLTMLEAGRAQTVVATADFVYEVDALQYRLAEGPCLLAMQSRRMQMSGSLGGEARWTRFGPRAGRAGVHSVLALPLLLPHRVMGGINIYARSKDAFGHDAARVAELFARPAAVAVHNAQVLAQSQRLADELAEALRSRAVIDQALGILMSRTGASSEEAFDRLRAMSQSRHIKVAEVSQLLVQEAVRRARSRRTAEERDVTP